MTSEIEELETYGVTGPLRVISETETIEIRVAIERDFALDRLTAEGKSVVAYAGWHDRAPWARRMASLSVVHELVSEALGARCSVVNSELWVKPPYSKAAVPWHQDHAFWGPSGRIFSAWIALTPASAGNGGICFVRGSHTRTWPHLAVDQRLGGLDHGIPDHLFEREAVWAPSIAPGEAMVFTANTVHGSPESKSNQLRIGFAVRYALPGAGAA
jgi:ectoine hydroxylase-related dioxygenase (phytanoyl-CoA dioxygenase family)